ncbi:MAG: hypothetical protein KDC73_05950 [Ignavibacteriae bacterium]|nr:hypothetical protein [Ignavibacteriota bacterium]MCB9243730.1 hypothetical protein [Ignavibacteriales bacterium]
MGTIGDVKINVLMDNSRLNADIRAALSMLNEFRSKANKLAIVKISFEIDFGKLNGSLKSLQEKLSTSSTTLLAFESSLQSFQSMTLALQGRLVPTVELFGAFYKLIEKAPPNVRILIGSIIALTSATIALGTASTIASGGLNILLAAFATGIALIASSLGSISSQTTDISELETTLGQSSEQISFYSKNLEALRTIQEQNTQYTQLSKEKQDEYNQSLERVRELFPEVIVGQKELIGTELIAVNTLNDLIKAEQEKLDISQEVRDSLLTDEFENYISELSDERENLQDLQSEYKRVKEDIGDLEKEYGFLGEVITTLGDLNPVFENSLKDVREEIQESNSKVGDLKTGFTQLIAAGLKTGSLNNIFLRLQGSIQGNTEKSREFAEALRSIDGAALASLLGISDMLKKSSEMMALYSTALSLLRSGTPGAVDFFNRVMQIAQNVRERLEKHDRPTFRNSSRNPNNQFQKEDEKLSTEEEILRKIEEINKELELNKGLVGKENDLLDEQKKLYNELIRVRTGYDLEKEVREGEEREKQRIEKLERQAEEEQRIKKVQLEIDKEIAREKIQLIENEYERKQSLIELERRDRIDAIKESEGTNSQKQKKIDLANKGSKKDEQLLKIENAKGIISESLTAANSIASILKVGAHTFVGQLLSGLQQGLSLADSLSNILMLVFQIGSGGGSGIFGLLGGILGFAQGGRVPGSGSGDIVPAMLTPGEFVIKKGIVDKLGTSFFAWINGGLLPSMAGHYGMGGIVSASPSPVVNNSFDVHIDRRGDVHVIQKALQKLKSNNRYFGG